MPYRMSDTPPITDGGIAPMTAANFGQNENKMAKHAAKRTTLGSNTRVSASTPVFSPYVVLAGAPKSEASIVARPSPSSVRCSPGSTMKLRLHVELMAETSPICSIIVANANGMMVMIAVMASPESNPGPNSANTVLSHSSGSPTQSASATAEKSTSPIMKANTYDTMTPMRMGMILIIPRPHTLHTTIAASATRATSQFVEQFSIAELERISPMEMTIGPVTTGGKYRMTRSAPNALKSPAKMG